MRKVDTKIEDIIEKIKSLKGESVDVEVSRGRKKALKFSGMIENIYPSIFTVKAEEGGQGFFSCSYAEVLCGNVKLEKNSDLQADGA